MSGPHVRTELRRGASTCQTTGRGEGQPAALKRQTPGKSTSWLITTGVHGANRSSLPKCPIVLCASMREPGCVLSVLGRVTGSGSCPYGAWVVVLRSQSLGTRGKVEAFCSVASGSGMIDLADVSHCKPKGELTTQLPHLWSDAQHPEMGVDMCPSLAQWVLQPKSVPSTEDKVTVPRNRERSTQDVRAQNRLLEPTWPHHSFYKGRLLVAF